jgi:hypothetical protein
MRRLVPLVLAVAALGGAALAQPAGYTPGPLNIELPADWQTRFIRYATVDRPDRRIIRHIYVNPESAAAARPGQPLPDGTLLVMADTRARLDAAGNPLLDLAGRFIPEPGWIAIGVQEKRAGWGEGLPADIRNGTWEYARFNPDGTRLATATTFESVRACYACHIQARSRQDFAFTYWDYVQARR